MTPGEAFHRCLTKWHQIREEAALADLNERITSLKTLHSNPSWKVARSGQPPSIVLEGLVEELPKIRDGKWAFCGRQSLEVDLPPIWQCDYRCRRDLSTTQWAKNLDHRRLPEPCDIRIIWELNRWVHLVRLAQGVYLSIDHEDAVRIIEWLEDWVRKNPTGRGWNWTNPMEPAIRLINFTWIHVLLSNASIGEVLTSRLEKLVLAIVPGHVWWVWRYHSVGSSANNHLLGELAGLIMAVTRWPKAKDWAEEPSVLSELLEGEALNQFHSDGGNKEQGLHYHLFAFEMIWQSKYALSAVGLELNDRTDQRLKKAAGFFTSLAQAEEAWDYGDSDDAVISPLTSHHDAHVEEWKDWMRSDDDTSLGFWIGKGPSAASGNSNSAWHLFEVSGLAFYQTRAFSLRFDVSPLGYGKMAAHGHLDALHLSLWHGGKALIIDPGTGGYYASPQERNWLTSWQAHNGPYLVSDHSFPERYGPFLWSGHHETPSVESAEDGRIEASLTLPGGVVSRHILVEGEDILVVDCSSSQSPFMVHWTIAPEWHCEHMGNRVTAARDDIVYSIEVTTGSISDLIVRGKDEPIEVGEGLCSRYYQYYEWASIIKCQYDASDCKLITRITTG